MSTTVVYDTIFTPRVTLTRTDAGGFIAVIEVGDLTPQRGPTAEELGAGVTALAPPTVQIGARRVRAEAHRLLIDTCRRAAASAAVSALEPTRVRPADLLMLQWRVALGVRGALRELDEEI